MRLNCTAQRMWKWGRLLHSPAIRVALLSVAAVFVAACGQPPAPAPPAEASGESGSGIGLALEVDASPVVAAPPRRTKPEIYTILDGDNLGKIARKFECRVDEIRTENNLENDLIRAGRELIIPVCAPKMEPGAKLAAGEYEIRPGDFLDEIASKAGCSTAEVMVANGLVNDVIYAGKTLKIPACSMSEGSGAEARPAARPKPRELAANEYFVEPGDTLGAIAERFQVDTESLRQENRIKGDFIRAGQLLTIPKARPAPEQDAEPAPSKRDAARGRAGAPKTETPSAERRRPAKPAPDSRPPAPSRAEPEAAAPASGGDLESLLAKYGYTGTRTFKAYVIGLQLSGDRSEIVSERTYDYRGTGDDISNWNAASTVKLYAAAAALQKTDEMGYSPDASITFAGGHDWTVRKLVERAIGPSDNIAYDFLVSFVGFDELNRDFFTRSNGFRRTGLRRAYESARWMQMGYSSSFVASPGFEIRDGGKRRSVPARTGSYESFCYSAACTSLRDLTEAMKRVMMQEQLGPSRSFDLSRESLALLRAALRSERKRGNEVVDGLAAGMPAGTKFYHKAGYAGDWYSDNVYVAPPTGRRVWVVAMANHPGRSSLNGAARAMGKLLASGDLGE